MRKINHLTGLIFSLLLVLTIGCKKDQPDNNISNEDNTLEVKGMTITEGILTKMENKDIPSNGHITIPNTVTNIGKNAFENCDRLVSLTISNSVKKIEKGAFGNCKNLIRITFGSAVEEIDVFSFVGCDKITNINLLCENPPKLKTYFGNGFSIKNIRVPSNSVDKYKNSKDWEKFKHLIRGIEIGK